MTPTAPSLTERPAWKALEAHYQKVRDLHLRKLFADDPKRGERMTAEAAGLLLDYSKNRVTDETLKRGKGSLAKARIGHGGDIARRLGNDKAGIADDESSRQRMNVVIESAANLEARRIEPVHFYF